MFLQKSIHRFYVMSINSHSMLATNIRGLTSIENTFRMKQAKL